MFNTGNGYTLSDIAAVTGRDGNRGGFGGDGDYWWLILLFLFAGNGNWGFGGNGAGAGTVRDELAYSFDMNGLENGVRGIQQGLCDGFYAINTGLLNGFTGVGTAITTNGYQVLDALHAGFNGVTAGMTGLGTQIASCCCDMRSDMQRGFCDLGYAVATQGSQTRQAIADSTRDIIDSQNAGTRAILDFLTQDKIASLTAENQALRFAASQSAQNTFITASQEAQTAELIRRLSPPTPVPAYVVPNPNCCYETRTIGVAGGCYGCG